jgi:hypothetical protein
MKRFFILAGIGAALLMGMPSTDSFAKPGKGGGGGGGGGKMGSKSSGGGSHGGGGRHYGGRHRGGGISLILGAVTSCAGLHGRRYRICRGWD